MKLKQINETLEADVLTENEDGEMDIIAACGSDLMSDVMAFTDGNIALLTGLINPQVIRTAEMMDIRLVIFVRGKVPSKDIIELANEKRITVISTKLPMFVACGKLYQAGISGRGVCC